MPWRTRQAQLPVGYHTQTYANNTEKAPQEMDIGQKSKQDAYYADNKTQDTRNATGQGTDGIAGTQAFSYNYPKQSSEWDTHALLCFGLIKPQQPNCFFTKTRNAICLIFLYLRSMVLRNKRFWIPIVLLGLFGAIGFSFQPAPAAEADAVIGTWVLPDGGGQVQIYKSGTKYFGKVAWLRKLNHPDGRPKVDEKNPDPKLRTRPILGLVILKNFEYDSDNEWDNGTIYDPLSGTEYSGTLTLDDNNTLTVRGYIGFSIFGQSQTWKRK
jgi:uncharacterized protein (DUF2147 family)